MIERERGPIKYEIIKQIGVLNTYPTGWSKEFNLVRWNDRTEKYDVRDWAPGHDRMSRGVTLHEGELKKLMELCNGLFKETQESKTAAAAQMPAQESKPETAAQMPAQENQPADTAQMPPQNEMPAADKVAEEVPF